MANGNNQPPPVYTSVDTRGVSLASIWKQWFDWLSLFIRQFVVDYTNTSIVAPLTGFIITIGNMTNVLTLNPATPLANGTVIMPVAPYDGMVEEISTTKTITSFTLIPSPGQTIMNAPTTLLAGIGIKFYYNTASSTWFRLY